MSALFPATLVRFPANMEGRSAAFFLAAEEFVAREMSAGNYAFFWQLRPTCVFGRHQDPLTELDIEFCREHGVELVRRKSGGGTIFADEDNIMVSLITSKGSVVDIFQAFSHTVADGLRRIGIPTKVSGRNDICLDDGRKVCGGAFYHFPNRNIVHCTMLYDTQMELMRGCLTPSRAKLESKGVKSVPSRIGLLKEFYPYGAASLRHELGKMLTDRSLTLTMEQLGCIERSEKSYHDPAYVFGKGHTAPTKPLLNLSRRVEGCGNLDIYIYCDNSPVTSDKSGYDGEHNKRVTSTHYITDVRLAGDFFETGDVLASVAFRKALCGINLTRESIKEALAKHHPERSIRGLTTETLQDIFSASVIPQD